MKNMFLLQINKEVNSSDNYQKHFFQVYHTFVPIQCQTSWELIVSILKMPSRMSRNVNVIMKQKQDIICSLETLNTKCCRKSLELITSLFISFSDNTTIFCNIISLHAKIICIQIFAMNSYEQFIHSALTSVSIILSPVHCLPTISKYIRIELFISLVASFLQCLLEHYPNDQKIMFSLYFN